MSHLPSASPPPRRRCLLISISQSSAAQPPPDSNPRRSQRLRISVPSWDIEVLVSTAALASLAVSIIDNPHPWTCMCPAKRTRHFWCARLRSRLGARSSLNVLGRRWRWRWTSVARRATRVGLKYNAWLRSSQCQSYRYRTIGRCDHEAATVQHEFSPSPQREKH